MPEGNSLDFNKISLKKMRRPRKEELKRGQSYVPTVPTEL